MDKRPSGRFVYTYLLCIDFHATQVVGASKANVYANRSPIAAELLDAIV